MRSSCDWCRVRTRFRLLWIGSFVTQLSAAHRAIIDWNASVIIVSLRWPVPSSDTKPRRFKFCTANLPPDTYAESFIYRVHAFSSTTRFAKLTNVHILTSITCLFLSIRLSLLSVMRYSAWLPCRWCWPVCPQILW